MTEELAELATKALRGLHGSPVILHDDRIGTTHAVMLSYPEDDVLGASNIACIIRDYPDCDEGSYGGAFGRGLWLIVPVLDEETGEVTETFGHVAAIVKDLAEQYPVYDEDDWSEREYEDCIETLIQCYDVPRDQAGEVYSRLEWAGSGADLRQRDVDAILWEDADDDHAYQVDGWDGVAWRVWSRSTILDRVKCSMVGDDREYVFDPADLTELAEDEYCGGCGQVGCTAHA